MTLVAYLLFVLYYLIAGYGVVTLFRLTLRTAYTIALSLLLGIAVASLLPFLLQLLHIPLTTPIVFGSLLLAAILLNIPTLRRIRSEGWKAVWKSLNPGPFRILAYEIPFLVIFIFLALVSIWRCYYLPPTSRDALSGPEAIAEFAVREHSMINSFFNIDLASTNNQFKSPFLISLQLICKLAGFPFGQVWLSVVFVSFIVFIYHSLKESLHPIIAGLLLLMLMMTPELYAYTFMILYDYSNMVFFFLSLWFLFGYFRNQTINWFYLSGLLMGIATYIRSETLVLALLFIPPIVLAQVRTRMTVKQIIFGGSLFLLPSLLLFFLPGPLYINYYLPLHYPVGGLMNQNLSDWRPLFQRYSDIVTRLIGSSFGVHLWGYLYFFAAFFLAAEVFARDRFNRTARNWLYAMLVLYLGLGALGFVLPLMNLDETTKRGMFKMLPLLLLYLGNNAWLLRLSRWISRWEGAPVGLQFTTGRPAAANPALAVSGTGAAAKAMAPKPAKRTSPASGTAGTTGTGAAKPTTRTVQSGKSVPGKKRRKK
jgi:hypothetical protein